MKNYDLKILQEYVNKKLLHMQVHPTLPLRIYKYTHECVYSRSWDAITLNMRGTVIDNNGQVCSHPFPKFFNLEELQILGLTLPDEPYEIYDKVDGSLIQVFNYNGEWVVASTGSFTSPHAVIAEKLLNEKYSEQKKHLNDDFTYLFELVFPLNKIVLDYGNEEKLILLASIRTENGFEWPNILETYKEEYGFDVAEKINLNLNQIQNEIQRPDFINKEGFVVKFKNGFRVKVKYAEYFRLHKEVSRVNERFVWEFMSQGLPIELTNVPDETFQFIKDTQKMLQDKFDSTLLEASEMYENIIKDLNGMYFNNWTKKEFALYILPKYKKWAGILFKMYENRNDDVKTLIWERLRPKYEKGQGGFQSMKIQ